jgi:DNA transposition AAA+ family ATPase
MSDEAEWQRVMKEEVARVFGAKIDELRAEIERLTNALEETRAGRDYWDREARKLTALILDMLPRLSPEHATHYRRALEGK